MTGLVPGFLRTHARWIAIGVPTVLLLAAGVGWLAGPATGPSDTAPTPTAQGAAVPGGDRASAGADTDGDGLRDLVELTRWGTDPSRPDTDGDGLPDGWEARHAETGEGRHPCPDPLAPDASRSCVPKGHPLAADFENGTDPHAEDTDGDGIPDAFEASHGMNPLQADAEADPIGNGLTNRERYRHGASAARVDTACSGMTDLAKIKRGLDPSSSSTGGSGVPDGWALFWNLNPRDPSIGVQRLAGEDELTVLETARASFARVDLCATAEDPTPPFEKGLDPRDPDSDDDGMPDAWEIEHGLDPVDSTNAGPVSPAVAERVGLPPDDERISEADPTPSQDLDGDGLSNLDAYLLGACPTRPDCDGDGLTTREEALDGWEVTVDGRTRQVYADPMRRVTDGDRIPDGSKRNGSWTVDGRTYRFDPLDPRTPDTDGDGLPDGREVTDFPDALDPTLSDTDADRFKDGPEVDYWTRRAAEEPDRSDRLCPLCSFEQGNPPNVANPDVDGDQVKDGGEVNPGTRPVEPGARVQAPFPATDPADPDTDGDQLPEAWERRNARYVEQHGRWDLDASRANSFEGLPIADRGCPDERPCSDAERDLEPDGLANADEHTTGTDPHAEDTDDDGLPDGWEFQHGSGGGARFPREAPVGHGFTWQLTPGAVIGLSPTNPADAGATVARYTYTRFTENTQRLLEHEAVVSVDGSGPAEVEGSVRFTFLDVHEAGLAPERPDADGDELPDLYERFWSRPPVGEEGLMSPDAPDGTADPDRDDLTNAEELAAGTDPTRSDTDQGGLSDALEAELGLDPLDPSDDAGSGDVDGDGLTNAEELDTYRTALDDVDTDGDGLLDGPTIEIPRGSAADPDQAQRRDELRSSGIVYEVRGEALAFLGEFELTDAPSRGCALTVSCAGDGLPDSWKVVHGLDPLRFYTENTVLTADGLTVHEKYRWGRPEGWNETEDGAWWLGLSPTRADTNHDGLPDDADTRVDGHADLDLDGLNDLTGADPHPFHDRDNDGGLDLDDREAVFEAFRAREDREPRAPPETVDANLSPTGSVPDTLTKGRTTEFTVDLTTSAGPPPAGTPVLAELVPADAEGPPDALRTGDARRVVGLGFTDADGRAQVEIALVGQHAHEVPPTTAALFGQPAPARASWTADTARLVPGEAYRLVVHSYAVDTDGRVVNGTAWSPGEPVQVQSPAAFEVDGPLSTPAGSTLTLNATLVDGAGDPHAPLSPGRLDLLLDGRVIEPAEIDGANLSFEVEIAPDVPPENLTATLRYGGDGRLDAGNRTLELRPRIPTRLTGNRSAERVDIGSGITVAGRLTARGTGLADAPIEVHLAGTTRQVNTTPSGKFSTTLTVDPSSTPGTRTPTLAYPGGTHYEATSVELDPVLVRAAPHFENVTANLTLADGGTVTGRLLTSSSTARDPFTGAPPPIDVEVSRFSTTARHRANGSFEARVPASALPGPGPVTVALETAGNRLMEAARTSTEVPVRSNVGIAVGLPHPARGQPLEVTGRLLDDARQPLPDLPVEAELAGAVAEGRTDEQGRFVLDLTLPTNASLGETSLTVTTPGDPPALPASGTTVNVRIREALAVELLDVNASLADPRVRFGLRRADGEPVVSSSVTIEAAGASHRRLTDGEGELAITLPGAELGLGTHPIRLTAPPQGDRAGLDARIDVHLRRPSSLDLGPPSAPLRPGEQLTVPARLTTTKGQPIPDARLVAELASIRVGEATTEEDGSVRIPLDLPQAIPLGGANLTVAFPGAGEHAATRAGTPVLFREAASVHVEAEEPVRAGQPARLSVALTRADGRPLANAPVTVDAPGLDRSLTARTDANGTVRLGGIPTPQTGELVARYLGSDEHAPAQASLSVASAETVDGPGLDVFWVAAGVGLLAVAMGLRVLYARYSREVMAEVQDTIAEAERSIRADNEHAATVYHAYGRLVDALEAAGLVGEGATPRQVEARLAAAFDLPPEPLDTVVSAFEQVRYGGRKTDLEDVTAIRRSLARLSRALEVEVTP